VSPCERSIFRLSVTPSASGRATVAGCTRIWHQDGGGLDHGIEHVLELLLRLVSPVSQGPLSAVRGTGHARDGCDPGVADGVAG